MKRIALLAAGSIALSFHPLRAEIISVPGDHPTIAEALTAAVYGDEIVIAAGTYPEGGLSLKTGVIIRGATGNYTHVIVDGEDAQTVFFAEGVDGSAELRDLTVTGGSGANGGGLRCWVASPTIANCRFQGNAADNGGAMAIQLGSSPSITNCRFESNQATCCEGGALYIENNSSVQISGCDFEGNIGRNGGGIHVQTTDLTLVDCLFEVNTATFNGGGVNAGTGSSCVLIDCVFQENGAGVGGGAVARAVATLGDITDCFFEGNTADYGGALFCRNVVFNVTGCQFLGNIAAPGYDGYGGAVFCESNADPLFENCTFYANSAVEGGALYAESNCSPGFTNCIIAFGAGGGAVACESGLRTILLDCCDLFGNVGGDWTGCIAGQDGGTNFSADPLFCPTPPSSLWLQTGSPCLPGNHPNAEDCGLIGALGEDADCDGQPVSAVETWSTLKRMY